MTAFQPKPFQFDPAASLWVPDGADFQPGFVQLPSGLWVPEGAAGNAWNYSTLPTIPVQFTSLWLDNLKQAMANQEYSTQQCTDLIHHNLHLDAAAWLFDMTEKIEYAPMPPVLFSKPPSPCPWGPAQPSTAELSHTEIWNDFGGTLATALPFQRESHERAVLEDYLVNMLDVDPSAARRLAELLWLGTEVCCLNLRRANQRWYDACMKPRKSGILSDVR